MIGCILFRGSSAVERGTVNPQVAGSNPARGARDIISLFIKNIFMAKRAAGLKAHKKSNHSHKTKKRLEIKRLMLVALAAKRRRK